MKTITALILLFVATVNVFAQVQRLSLDENWRFKQKGDTVYYRAEVPGCIHTDLLKNKLIPDPFFGDNEKNLQWIENRSVVYECSFNVEKSNLESDSCFLVFDGIDTYAKVFLNDSLILRAANMFLKYRVDVRSILKGRNRLRVEFSPPLANVDTGALKHPGGPQVYVRKSPFMFGWDWGPRYATMGIYKDVYLEFVNNAEIIDVYVKQSEISSEKAVLNFEIELGIYDKGDYSLEISSGEKILVRKNCLKTSAGRNFITQKVEISKPVLWWPNGMGQPYLYRFSVILKNSGDVIDSIGINTGLRNIELVNAKDSAGTSFYFKVNGKPLFVKGANYIPQNIFLPEVTRSDYERLLNDVKKSNMNMLRVWGGGFYENDYFYDLCDRNGILVWQDFMFACTTYPFDDEFLQNVEKEAVYQVKRLRNHACIALWCGNNEVSEGMHNWGWKRHLGYSPEEWAEITAGYDTLFAGLLPQVVKSYCSTPYWESSPQYGRGNPLSASNGDFHYWGVWHDAEPFENFNVKTGRFMSEYGFQAYPDIKTVKAFADNADLSISSPAILNHQKHSRGNKLIKKYMLDNYGVVPGNFEEFIYLSQQTQALGIETAIKAQRRNMPFCMGSLYWQLNDCWPAISWSGIDYFGRWKAMQYTVRNNYKPVIISAVKTGDQVRIYIVSDLLTDTAAVLKTSLIDFYGKTVKQKKRNIVIRNGKSLIYETVSVDGIDTVKTALSVELLIGDTLLQRNVVLLSLPRYAGLPEADFISDYKLTDTTITVSITAKVLMKNVWIELPDTGCGNFSDNNFDLLPGETKTVSCRLLSKIKGKPRIVIRSVND